MTSLSQRLDRVKRLYPSGTNLGLERILALLTRLGSPHQRLPRTIHVAGTNGKGSTIAMVRSMLEAAHHKVHVYTSPHLIKLNERIVLAGQEIEEAYLLALIEKCKKEACQDITWFELTTAAAFLAFSEVSADFLLLETGLGGRLDATNVVENPALTILTSLSMDHTEYLGNTLEKIAYEKAGILKANCPLITLQHSPEAQSVIMKRAAELNCPLFIQKESWQIRERAEHLEFMWDEKPFIFPRPELAGFHQIQNAGLALATGFYLGIDPFFLAKGLREAVWPGRLERFPASEGIEAWLDGAHNPGGGAAILETLLKWQQKDGLPLYLVVGMIQSKDHEAFLRVFQNHVHELFIVPVQHEDGWSVPEVLYQKAQKIGFSATVCPSLKESLRQVYSQTDKKPFRVLICGSLYLVAEALKLKDSFRKSVIF